MFVRDESGKAVAANKDELSRYRAEKQLRYRIAELEQKVQSFEDELASINRKIEDLLRMPNG